MAGQASPATGNLIDLLTFLELYWHPLLAYRP